MPSGGRYSSSARRTGASIFTARISAKKLGGDNEADRRKAWRIMHPVETALYDVMAQNGVDDSVAWQAAQNCARATLRPGYGRRNTGARRRGSVGNRRNLTVGTDDGQSSVMRLHHGQVSRAAGGRRLPSLSRSQPELPRSSRRRRLASYGQLVGSATLFSLWCILGESQLDALARPRSMARSCAHVCFRCGAASQGAVEDLSASEPAIAIPDAETGLRSQA